MSPLMRQVLESKRRRRVELAALPYPEKVKIVEQMRKAMIGIRAAAPTEKPGQSVSVANRLIRPVGLAPTRTPASLAHT